MRPRRLVESGGRPLNSNVRRYGNVALTLLRAAIPGFLAVYAGWQALVGIKSGAVRTRLGLIHRGKEPVGFWTAVTALLILAAVFVGVAIWLIFWRPA